jgi:hypothetical protein
MTPGSNQMQLSASSRGIVDHFFCFDCDEYVWDCDHLIDEDHRAKGSRDRRRPASIVDLKERKA